MMKRSIQAVLLMALLAILLVAGCEKVGDPLTVSQFQLNRNVSLFSSGTGMIDRRVFYSYETIFFTFENLYPSEQTDVQIVRLSDGKILKRLLVFTDPDGVIRDLPIWYYITHDGPDETKAEDGKYVVHLLQPGITNPWLIYSICFEIRDELPPTPQIRVVDPTVIFKTTASGIFAGSQFLSGSVWAGGDVWLEGSKMGAHKNFKLLVVPDRDNWVIGDAFTDVTGFIETEKSDKSGDFPPVKIWSGAVLGSYDVVADYEPYGVYNAGDVIQDPLIAGLIVQNHRPGGDLIQDIACDQFGNYKDVFDSLETVYARISSKWKPGLTSEFVTIYITPHKAVWKQGDPLVALSTVGTFEMPVSCLWNAYAGSFPVIKMHGLPLPNDPAPRKMWPGEYDVVIDVDRNYFYDPGIDILDGGVRPGFVVPGKVPPVRMGASGDLDFLGVREEDPNLVGWFRDEIHTSVWGVLVDSLGNFYKNVPVKFKIIQGGGTLDRDQNITTVNGNTWSVFYGGGITYGGYSIVQLTAEIGGKPYVRDVLILRKLPFQHTQGTILCH